MCEDEGFAKSNMKFLNSHYKFLQNKYINNKKKYHDLPRSEFLFQLHQHNKGSQTQGERNRPTRLSSGCDAAKASIPTPDSHRHHHTSLMGSMQAQ